MVNYPKDWRITSIGDLFETITDFVAAGSFKDLSDNVKYYSTPNYAQLIRTTDIKSKFRNNDFVYIDKDAYEYLWRVHFNGTKIIMPNIGNCGEVYILEKDLLPYKRCALGPNAIMLFKTQHDMKFLYYVLHNDDFQESLKDIISPSGQKKFNKTELSKLEISIPSVLSEQKAIAKTLMVFDEHIENLEELIAKKKMIRDGAVEDLMSGKTRLDGFDGEWETVKFSKYFTKIKNNTFSRDMLSSNGEVGNIHYGDVLIKFGSVLETDDNIPKIKADVVIRNPAYLKENDVIIADTAEDETVGKATQIGDIKIPLVSGLHTIPCRPNFKSAPKFLGYYINSNVYHSQLLPYITGIKVSSISKQSIDETMLYIPTDINEQKAIADILTAMDEEIEDLRQEKDKIEKIKAGAMDDLLTGKIRLVKEA